MGRESFFAGQSSALLSCFLASSLVLPSRVAWLILECARRTRHRSSIFSLEGGLDGLPLRVSNEGLLRPRVARAQETL